jgi:hypothetical protein
VIKVALPANLQALARAGRIVELEVNGPVTQRSVLDALEAGYPALLGTIRDPVTKRRRPLLRFFACEEDFSDALPDDPLPVEVASGREPLLILGAIAGGREVTVAEQLENLPAAVRPTMQAARKMVKAIAPRAEEIAYQGGRPRSRTFMWKLARYSSSGANVVGIGTFPDHSNLFFYRGRELDDGSGLLVGRGKEMRSISLRTPADVDKAAVKRLVRKAFQLAGEADAGS